MKTNDLVLREQPDFLNETKLSIAVEALEEIAGPHATSSGEETLTWFEVANDRKKWALEALYKIKNIT